MTVPCHLLADHGLHAAVQEDSHKLEQLDQRLSDLKAEMTMNKNIIQQAVVVGAGRGAG